MKYNDWDESLKFGGKGEELFVKTFKGVFEPVLKKIDFNLFPQTQKQGVDVLLSNHSIEFDVKSRTFQYYKWKDILVETISVVESNKDGWVYYTKSEYIVYVWFNQSKTKFIDGYLINLPCFKSFFKTNIDTFRQPRDAVTTRNGRTWHTQNKIVPINQIPKPCIKRIDVGLVGIRNQTALSKFFDIFNKTNVKNQSMLTEW